jgi:bifunctional non-homologous end joining protein LigD
VTYAKTGAFARAIAELLQRAAPELVVSNMRKALREGKVLVDWSQNDAHKTTVAPYSLRAKEHPTVSTPLKWREVERSLQNPDLLKFEAGDILQRVKKLGDLFAPVLKLRQKLPSLATLVTGHFKAVHANFGELKLCLNDSSG